MDTSIGTVTAAALYRERTVIKSALTMHAAVSEAPYRNEEYT
jgi:hypothetical protein